MRRKTFRVQPAVDADGLAKSQTPAGSGNLTLNGDLISGGVWSSSIGQLVTITCAGNDAARTFTVTGTDYNGYAVTSSIAGSNGSTTTGTVYFYRITSIAVDAATAGAVTVGFAGGAVSPPFTVNYKMSEFKAALGVDVSGTINWTIQRSEEHTSELQSHHDLVCRL